ncbi:MAG: response regulator, partial [Anaerolineales bacterium]|nr:response regulator [Anaerolineales bacterium]
MCRERILIVDDEPRVAFFFRKHLELTEGGYIVDVANSGNQALAAVQRERYDLMITDLRMPGMNGLELLGRIREISPTTRTMLITAFGTADVWQRASELQVAQLLSKPLKVDALLSAVRDTLTMDSPAGES